MAQSSVKVTSTLSKTFVPLTIQELDRGMLELATDIHKRSTMLAPVETRNLVNSGRIERIASGLYRIIYGSSKVRYARRRHFENRKNPQTIGYLSKAGDSVARSDPSKYLRKRT